MRPSFQQHMQAYLKAKQDAAKQWAIDPRNPANQCGRPRRSGRRVGQATGQSERASGRSIGAYAAAISEHYRESSAAGRACRPARHISGATAAQGGGNSSPAAFPTAPVQPVAADAGVPPVDAAAPTLSTSTSGASVARS